MLVVVLLAVVGLAVVMLAMDVTALVTVFVTRNLFVVEPPSNSLTKTLYICMI